MSTFRYFPNRFVVVPMAFPVKKKHLKHENEHELKPHKLDLSPPTTTTAGHFGLNFSFGNGLKLILFVVLQILHVFHKGCTGSDFLLRLVFL